MIKAVATLSRWSLPLVLVAITTGCGERRESAPVSGVVTIDGKPQEGIFIYFKPDLPPGHDPLKGLSQSYARTDKEGKFSMKFMDVDKDRDGAIVTSHTVTADDERTFGSGMEPDEQGGRRPIRSRVPPNWSARIDVPPEGTTEANFDFAKSSK